LRPIPDAPPPQPPGLAPACRWPNDHPAESKLQSVL
jgi:hypothetical protein